MNNKILDIYISYKSKDILVGYFYVDIVKQKEIYSFEFSDEYIKLGKTLIYDSELMLGKGRQYKTNPNEIFGFIFDVIPDRWGKNLIVRNENIICRSNNKKVETLLESDYLVRISDFTRMGALRISKHNSKEFLSNKTSKDVPNIMYINKLEQIAFNIEELSDEDAKDLFEPGSSLGGARPKAVIYDNDNNLYLAKFSKKSDSYDVCASEMISNELASLCGINVPERKYIKSINFNDKSIFLVKRFDRNKSERIPYVSAMTLLDAKDGESNNYSYLDLLNLIKKYSSNPIEDSNELYRRLIFNCLIHNTDDHLRNHGFLINDKGLRLSPAFDINPIEGSLSSSLLIDGYTSEFNLDTIVSISKFFNIDKETSIDMISNMKSIINKNLKILCNKYNFDEKLFRRIASI